MKVILQDVNTLQFVREGGGWTRKPQLALDFGSVTDAVDYAVRRRLTEVRVVFKGPTPSCDVALPPMHEVQAG